MSGGSGVPGRVPWAASSGSCEPPLPWSLRLQQEPGTEGAPVSICVRLQQQGGGQGGARGRGGGGGDDGAGAYTRLSFCLT